MVVRDQATIELAMAAFFSGIRRVWGIERGASLIFVMPRETRVAMARTARLGTRHLDWASDGEVHFTVPFAATPDQLRIRAGRTFSPGLAGQVERRILNPFMGWANEHLAGPRYIAETLTRLRASAASGRPTMLLGGLVQLHAIARELIGRGQSSPSPVALRLPPGSRVPRAAVSREQYPWTPVARFGMTSAAALGDVPVSDVYGMAEANWAAAFECAAGNHHIPPWVAAVSHRRR